jgi:hypothetical protein
LLKNSPFGKYVPPPPPPPKEVPKPVSDTKAEVEKPKPEPKLDVEFRSVVSFNSEKGKGSDVFSFYNKTEKRSFTINTGVNNESDPFSIVSYDSDKKLVRIKQKNGAEQDVTIAKQDKQVVTNGSDDYNTYGNNGYDSNYNTYGSGSDYNNYYGGGYNFGANSGYINYGDGYGGYVGGSYGDYGGGGYSNDDYSGGYSNGGYGSGYW